MNIWRELGIGQTRDKDAITDAYRDKLAVTNPEDDPEGFMLLRAAYEEAIKAADEDGEMALEKDSSPLGRWMENVEALYRAFSKRIDSKEWEMLLEDPACQNLDSKVKARDKLLDFMMEHVFLPQSVVIILDKHFHFQENVKELLEEYPRSFIENIILDSIANEEYPPYTAFEGDDSLDYDEYLTLSSELSNSIGNYDVQESRKILAKMERTGVKTPYLQLEKVKVCCQEEKYDDAEALIEELVPEHGDLTDVALLQADIAFFKEDYETAQRAYEAVLEKAPESSWARHGVGKCLVKAGKYRKANELFWDLLENDPYDSASEGWLKESNHLLIEELEREGSSDLKALLDLGWAYFQTGQYEAVLKVIEGIKPTEEFVIDYYNLAGRTYVFLGENEKALQCLKTWEDLLRRLKDDGTKEVQSKRSRLHYAVYLQGLAYLALGERDRALACLEEAVTINPQDSEARVRIGQILSETRDFAGAVEAYTKAIDVDNDSHAAYALRAQAFYQMEYYSEAYDDCEKAIEIYSYELGPYLYKAQIFIEVGEFQEAAKTIEFLEEEGLLGSEIEFLKGYLLEGQRKFAEAETIYRQILAENEKQKEQGENVFNMDNTAEVYHHLAMIHFDEESEDFAPVVEIIDGGLKQNENYVPLLGMKAQICEMCDKPDEALKLYLQIQRTAPKEIGIYGHIDDMYRELDKWEDALKYATLQLEQMPTAYYYMRRGQILTCLDRLDEGWADFSASIELDPDQPYTYNYMGTILEFRGKEEEALEYYHRAISISEREEETCEEAYRNAANLYCRKREYKKAVHTLEKSYEASKDSKDIYGQIEIYRLGGFFAEAKEALDRFRQIEGLKKKDFLYQWELAHIYRDSGDSERAFDIYDVEGVLEPVARKQAGMILYYQGKFKKALKFFRKALKDLNQDHDYEIEKYQEADFYLWGARTYRRLGNYREAGLYAAEGLKRIPVDYETQLSYCRPTIEKILGGLYTVQGNYEKARTHLERALEGRKCDYCNYEKCVDAYYELGYLSEQEEQDLEKVFDFWNEGKRLAPFDYDLTCAIKNLKERNR